MSDPHAPPIMSLPKSHCSSVHTGELPDDELAEYKNVFPLEVSKFPYSKHKAIHISESRAALGGSLFFDRLCSDHLDKVDNSKAFPG